MTLKQLRETISERKSDLPEAARAFLRQSTRVLSATATTRFMRQGSKGQQVGPNPNIGPGSLRRQTGRLSRSLTGAKESRASGLSESISEIEPINSSTLRLTWGSSVPYALVHEEGFNGRVQVGAHTRTQTQAFGQQLDPPQQVTVSAHSRRMNIPPRPYLEPTLDSELSTVKDLAAKTLAATIKGET